MLNMKIKLSHMACSVFEESYDSACKIRVQIIILKRKVAEMEARQQQKEMEWQKIVQESRRQVCNTQEFSFTEQQAFDAKTAEVEKFRHELSDILDAAGDLMQQSQTQ